VTKLKICVETPHMGTHGDLNYRCTSVVDETGWSASCFGLFFPAKIYSVDRVFVTVKEGKKGEEECLFSYQ